MAGLMHRVARLAALLAGLWLAGVAPGAAAAPVSVTDIAGREVTLPAPASRIVLGEARHLAVLGLILPDPVAPVVGWRTDKPLDPPTLAAYRARFPAVDGIRAVGSGNRGLSVETVLALKPDLVVLSLMDEGDPAMANARRQLEAAGIPVATVDFFAHPLKNTIPSLRVLGALTGASARAEDFARFYEARLSRIETRLSESGIASGEDGAAGPGAPAATKPAPAGAGTVGQGQPPVAVAGADAAKGRPGGVTAGSGASIATQPAPAGPGGPPAAQGQPPVTAAGVGAGLDTPPGTTASGRGRPRVFVHVHAAPQGCCATVGNGVFDEFITAAGGQNAAAATVPGVQGNVSLEALLAADPDVYVATGGAHMAARGGLVLGPEVGADDAAAGFAALTAAPGFSSLRAIREGRAAGVWHLFNDTPAHIALIEYLAKLLHPDLFADLDPQATLAEAEGFAPVAVPGTWWVRAAP